MELSDYQYRKTLKKLETGDPVDATDFVQALNQKRKREKNRNNAYSKIIKKAIRNIREEEDRNKNYRDTLEKKVKLCPQCGYTTVIENHSYLCIRKCKSCDWQSKPWKRNDNIFST